jgi:type I restriction enzyme S subunit
MTDFIRLGDIADITVGHVGPMRERYVSDGVPFLRSTNIKPLHVDIDDVKYIGLGFHKELGKSSLKPGDVVVVRTGRPGAAAVIPGSIPEANCSDLVVIRPHPGQDSHFLAYYINGAARGFVESRLVGAVQQHFNIGDAREMPVPRLALDRQRAIADVLGALDDLVDTNEQLLAHLDDLGMHLFTASWDGDTYCPLSNLGSLTMGQSPPGSTYNETGEGIVFYQGVRDFGAFYPKPRVYCTEPTRLALKGAVLIAVRAPVGVVNVAAETTAIGRGLAALDADQPSLARRALRVSADSFGPYQGAGTVFSSINKRDLASVVVPFVADKGLEVALRDVDEYHLELWIENEELRRTRDELVPLLLSGRVLPGEVKVV